MILPALFEDASVSTMVIKVSQGNQSRTGRAWLYHDGNTDAGEVLLGGLVGCEINETMDADTSGNLSTTVCELDGPSGDLSQYDSLSVFVKADNGSFEGATACVVIDEDTTE